MIRIKYIFCPFAPRKRVDTQKCGRDLFLMQILLPFRNNSFCFVNNNNSSFAYNKLACNVNKNNKGRVIFCAEAGKMIANYMP